MGWTLMPALLCQPRAGEQVSDTAVGRRRPAKQVAALEPGRRVVADHCARTGDRECGYRSYEVLAAVPVQILPRHLRAGEDAAAHADERAALDGSRDLRGRHRGSEQLRCCHNTG